MAELKLLNVTNLYIQRTCMTMHPFIHNTDQRNRPEHNNTYIYVAQIHDYRTRYSRKGYHYIPNKYKYAQHDNFNHDMEQSTKEKTRIWNTLPQPLRDERSITKFKAELKKHLLTLQNQ